MRLLVRVRALSVRSLSNAALSAGLLNGDEPKLSCVSQMVE